MVWKEQKLSRMEDQQQEIGADSRVFGEQGQEGQHTAHDACGAEQHQVDTPQSRPFADAVDSSSCGKYKKQEGTLERGGHPTAFFFLGKGVYDQLLCRIRADAEPRSWTIWAPAKASIR